jgi:type IV secretion system protein VirD4
MTGRKDEGRPFGRPTGRADAARWSKWRPNPLPSDVHGSAQWAWVSDLMRTGMFADGAWDGPGCILGAAQFRGPAGESVTGTIRSPNGLHRLVCGSTGSGKFTSVVAPLLLSPDDRTMIVIDPKSGEALQHTLAYRSSLGLVGVLTPEVTAKDVERERGKGVWLSINPLNRLTRESPTLVRDVKRLVDATLVRSGSSHHDYWETSAQRLLEGTIAYVALGPDENQRTLARVQQIIAEGWPDRVLFGMQHDLADFDLVANAGKELADYKIGDSGGPTRFFNEVRATLLNSLEFLDMPGVRLSLAETNFDPAELRQAEKPATIYIVVERQNMAVYARWLRIVYQTLIDHLTEVPGRDVVVVVDEFAALKRFDRVILDLATLRGEGVEMHLCVQDLSQLKQLYGDGWEAIIGNCGVRQFLGVNDHFTADYLSRMLGQTTVEKPYSHHVKPWGGEGPGFWKSETVGRPLLSPAEIINLPRNMQIILSEALGRPLRIPKVHYFAQEPWMSRASRGARR